MATREHKAHVEFLARIRAQLDAALAYRLPRTPPAGVPFEQFARDILRCA